MRMCLPTVFMAAVAGDTRCAHAYHLLNNGSITVFGLRNTSVEELNIVEGFVYGKSFVWLIGLVINGEFGGFGHTVAYYPAEVEFDDAVCQVVVRVIVRNGDDGLVAALQPGQ
jgi:hypothetical protein